MPDNTCLGPFPTNKTEALAYLYVKTLLDLPSLSPTDLLDKYDEAYKEIKDREKEKNAAKAARPPQK